jgi:DNA invertase Pin-like site-specific DNA recombinase
VYRDEGISGSKGRDKRPGFDAMHKDASRRKFDIVMAWSVDRLGRGLQDLIGFLSELHALGIDLALHQQGIDTTTPAGKAMFQMMGVFAEFERSMIVERVRAGVARAKASGTKSGKAFGRPRVPVETEQRIRDALATPGRPGFYDITARTVYLPSGRRLEANSGPGRAAPRAGKPSAAPECQQRRNSESVTLWRLLGGRDFIRSRRSLV